MKSGINPRVDYAFKKVFGSEETTDILIHMLNAVLSPPSGKEVTAVTLLNPFSAKDAAEDKLVVLDIKATDAEGRHFNIEMQIVVPPFYPQRVLYYWAKLYTDQLGEGDAFSALCPAISISFLDRLSFKDRDISEYHHRFRLRDQSGKLELCEHLDIHLIELPRFDLSAEELTTPLEVWCYFLKHGADIDTEELPKPLDIPPVRQALEVLNVMSHNDSERLLYEARIKARRDRTAELQEARQEGRGEGIDLGELIGRIHFGQELLGLSITPTEQLKSLSPDELAALADHLKQQAKARP